MPMPTPPFATVADRAPKSKKSAVRKNGHDLPPQKTPKVEDVTYNEKAISKVVAVPTNWSLVDWHSIPIAEGVVLLAELQRTWEHAAKVMQQRQQALEMVKCHCGCGRRLAPSQACMSKAMRDPKTLLPYNVYFATQECVRQYNRKVMNIPAGTEALPR